MDFIDVNSRRLCKFCKEPGWHYREGGFRDLFKYGVRRYAHALCLTAIYWTDKDGQKWEFIGNVKMTKPRSNEDEG